MWDWNQVVNRGQVHCSCPLELSSPLRFSPELMGQHLRRWWLHFLARQLLPTPSFWICNVWNWFQHPVMRRLYWLLRSLCRWEILSSVTFCFATDFLYKPETNSYILTQIYENKQENLWPSCILKLLFSPSRSSFHVSVISSLPKV